MWSLAQSEGRAVLGVSSSAGSGCGWLLSVGSGAAADTKASHPVLVWKWSGGRRSTHKYGPMGKSTVPWNVTRVIPQCPDKKERLPQEKVPLTVGCGHKKQLWKQKTYILLSSFNIVLPQSRTSPFLSQCQLFCSFFPQAGQGCGQEETTFFFIYLYDNFSWEDVQLPVSAQVGSAQV